MQTRLQRDFKSSRWNEIFDSANIDYFLDLLSISQRARAFVLSEKIIFMNIVMSLIVGFKISPRPSSALPAPRS